MTVSEKRLKVPCTKCGLLVSRSAMLRHYGGKRCRGILAGDPIVSQPHVAKAAPATFASLPCPYCGGQVISSYKQGRVWKCVGCSRVFPPRLLSLKR